MPVYYAFDVGTNEVILGPTDDLTTLNSVAKSHSVERDGHNIVIVQAVSSWLKGERIDALVAVTRGPQAKCETCKAVGHTAAMHALLTSGSPPAPTVNPPASEPVQFKLKVDEQEVDLSDFSLEDGGD